MAKTIKKEPSITDMEAELGQLVYKNGVLKQQINPLQQRMDRNGRRMNELGGLLEKAYRAKTPIPPKEVPVPNKIKKKK